MHWLIKTFFSLIALLALIMIGFMLYFHGDQVVPPLEKYLSAHLKQQVKIESAEFSPAYPGIIRLKDVSIGNTHADELYAEYSLTRLAAGTLDLNYLYLKGLKLDPVFRQKIKQGLGFKSFLIKRLRIEDSALQFLDLNAAAVRLDIKDVRYREGKLNLGSSSVRSPLLRLGALNLAEVSAGFSLDDQTIKFTDLQARLFEGRIQAAGSYDPGTQNLKLSQLKAANLILTPDFNQIPGLKLQIHQAQLDRVMYLAPQWVMSGISGTLSAASINDKQLNFNFRGNIEELSKPDLQLTFTDIEGRSNFKAGLLDFTLKGQFNEGRLQLSGTLNDQGLHLRQLNLAQAKLELKAPLINWFEQSLKTTSLSLDQMQLKQVSLLSFIDSLPLSIESADLSLSGLKLESGFKLSGNPAMLTDLNLTNTLYSDLKLGRISLTAALNQDQFTFTLPQLRFNQSQLLAAGSLALKDQGLSMLTVKAEDFDLSELNCNLWPYVFNGRADFNADLSSKTGFPKELGQLQGQASLYSDKLMISNFGLDLINGGKMTQYQLNLTRLLTALKDADCGMEPLSLKLSADQGMAVLSGYADLATAKASLQTKLDLNTQKLSGQADFISMPGDSRTQMQISGSLKDPQFFIKALSRGENRPGLLNWQP